MSSPGCLTKLMYVRLAFVLADQPVEGTHENSHAESSCANRTEWVVFLAYKGMYPSLLPYFTVDPQPSISASSERPSALRGIPDSCLVL